MNTFKVEIQHEKTYANHHTGPDISSMNRDEKHDMQSLNLIIRLFIGVLFFIGISLYYPWNTAQCYLVRSPNFCLLKKWRDGYFIIPVWT